MSLSSASSQAISVSYSTANGTATSGSDYTAIGATTLNFAAGQTTKTVTVSISNDTIYEGGTGETFFVNLTTPVNATIADNQGLGTITDNDPVPTVTSVTSPTVAEGANLVYAVTLSNGSATSTTLPFTLGGGTASAADYGAASYSNGVTVSGTNLIIPAGVTTFNVTVPASPDAINESGETVPLTVGGITGTGTISGNIVPSISINDVTVNEAAGTATFSVSLSSASSQAISVNYSTANGTATSGSDYTAIGATTLNFAAGETSKTVTVSIADDAVNEGGTGETFFVNLTTPVNATIADNQGKGTITDNEAAVTVTSITSPTVAEGTSLVYAVTLSSTTGVTTSIPFTLGGGTATAADYGTASYSNGVTRSGTNLIIPAGVSSFNVILPALTDALTEPGETVPLTIGGVTGVGTIAGTDPTISIGDISVNEGAGTATFTVSLSAASTKVIDVNYSSSNGTATAGSDFGAVASTRLTFAAGETSKTITVSIINDPAIEGNETFNINLASPVNATIAKATGVGTIIDNAAAPFAAPVAAPMMAMAVAPGGFADDDEAVKVNEDTTLKGSVLTGTSSANGTVTVSSYLVAGNSYVFKAGETATLAGVGTLVIAADGNYTFVPDANYSGSVPVVTYTVTDGSDSDTSTLSIAINPINDAPIAVHDTATTMVGASPLTIASSTLLINDSDPDGDPLTLFSVQGANHGSVAMVGSDVIFTPTAGYAGAASFNYTVSDGHGATSTTTVDITVNGAPVAAADSVTGTANKPLTIASDTLLSNDTDPNGDPLTISSVLDATHGTVALVGGSVVFTPTKDYVGDASFSYTISDGHGGTASATVSVTIAADLLKSGSTPIP